MINTLESYLAEWLSHIQHSIKPASHQRYSDIINHHISPHIGCISLEALKPLDVQRLYNNRLQYGLANSTVLHVHNILHSALDQAIKWELLTRNVTEYTTRPKIVPPNYTVWTKRQTLQFLEVSHDTDLACLWRIALLTGMRRGEILGLKWSDVDWNTHTLNVQRTYSRGATSFEFGEPKTRYGKRAIALPDSLMHSLKKHQFKQLVPSDMVFSLFRGEPIQPNTLRKRFNKLIAFADVPIIRFHDLRHTSATLMLATGIHPKIVQERLGLSRTARFVCKTPVLFVP